LGWLWGGFTLPGTIWLAAFFFIPFYAVAGVAFGTTDPIFLTAQPEWNPLQWDFTAFSDTLSRVLTGDLRAPFQRTIVYVFVAVALCFLIGYPVAYYLARYAGRTRTLLLALLVLPFWVSYLMRMLAWVNLLSPDGWVNRFLEAVPIFGGPRAWLDANPATVVLGLVYGYIPFVILPLYATLDRIDKRLLEAARDIGATPRAAFFRVTLPLSKQGCLAAAVIVALPMFGDYYTTDLLSRSPKTSMIGNQITFYIQNSTQKQVGASLVLILSVMLLVLMAYYVWVTARAQRELQL
jgi:spermidine/putrescine transport system permease protein